jgi:hypothetical protein
MQLGKLLILDQEGERGKTEPRRDLPKKIEAANEIGILLLRVSFAIAKPPLFSG